MLIISLSESFNYRITAISTGYYLYNYIKSSREELYKFQIARRSSKFFQKIVYVSDAAIGWKPLVDYVDSHGRQTLDYFLNDLLFKFFKRHLISLDLECFEPSTLVNWKPFDTITPVALKFWSDVFSGREDFLLDAVLIKPARYFRSVPQIDIVGITVADGTGDLVDVPATAAATGEARDVAKVVAAESRLLAPVPVRLKNVDDPLARGGLVSPARF